MFSTLLSIHPSVCLSVHPTIHPPLYIHVYVELVQSATSDKCWSANAAGVLLHVWSRLCVDDESFQNRYQPCMYVHTYVYML